MRSIISTIVTIILFIFVIYLANSGSIVLPDYWTGLSVALTVTALGILYWGFKPKIHGYFKEKRKTQKTQLEITPSKETEMQKSELLPDNSKITKLNIDNRLLDEIYEQAHRQAVEIYPDAQLSRLSIQVFPFQKTGKVTIYLYFYSKWADKASCFRYPDTSLQVEHSTPDRPAKDDYEREILTTLPWKVSPQWMQFLDRVYAKIGPFASAIGTNYHLMAFPTYWHLEFDDGFSGNIYKFEWDGRGLDKNSVRQLD
jgi:hypothetical protein